MAGQNQRVVARFGNSADVPTLIIGEIGYDVDKKTLRVGDDTPNPPRLLGDKSVGSFELPDVDYLKVNRIDFFAGGNIDGVTPSKLNIGNGVLTRIGDNDFAARLFEGDEYIGIENPDGVAGNPQFKIKDALFEAIKNAQGVLTFTYGESPPATPSNGSLFWSIIDFLLYIYIPSGETETVQTGVDEDDNPIYAEVPIGAWVDIASAGGGGAGGSTNGNRTFVGDIPPTEAFLGDKFIDTTDNYRIYMRMQDEGGVHWREVFTTN